MAEIQAKSLVKKRFAKYVSQNILGMVGMSAYILADTFFIAKAVGADGITALNLVLPLYSLIFAIGAMIGVGSAIRFTIEKNQGGGSSHYFFNAIFFATAVSVVFMFVGGVFPDRLMAALGGDSRIVEVGTEYTRIFMLFTPFFMYNHICNAFVRNDGAPTVAMAATLFSSLFNVVMDYVLMFPLGMGMVGASLATACSPITGVAICGFHFFSKKNTVSFKAEKPSLKKLYRSCQLGVSAFVGEFSSGVTTAVFNTLILGLAGNIGVAAYGVVANTALVAVSFFNGISQGAQPLLSEYYANRKSRSLKSVLFMSLAASVVISAVIILTVNIFAVEISNVFNSDGISELTNYAARGLKIYYIGFLFAGINIVGTGALSAIDSPSWAFAASVMRGFAVITVCAVVMSRLFGMNGVWAAFPAAEFITLFVTAAALITQKKKKTAFN